MNVIDKILLEWSYRCDKGYPSITSEKDLQIFESLFGFNLINEVKKDISHLSSQARQKAEEISEFLNIPIENFKAHTSSTIIILSDESRDEIFNSLEELGFERDVNISGSSTGGARNEDGIKVIIKPFSGQGIRSAGKMNEVKFIELINSHIEEAGEPITVVFKSSNKNLKYEKVAKCVDESRADSTSFFKADNCLKDKSGKILVNISLKKKNAGRWESSKRREIEGINPFNNFIDKVIDGKFETISLLPLEKKEKYKLFNPSTNTVLSKVILKNIPEGILNDVVFGNDNPKPIVIKETFEGGYTDFSFEKNILTINCDTIYTDIEDIVGTDDEPVYAFSNHTGQKFGIEFRAFSKKVLYNGEEPKGSAVEINFEDIK